MTSAEKLEIPLKAASTRGDLSLPDVSDLDEYLGHLEGDYEVQVEARRLGVSVSEYVQLVRDKYASLHREVP